MEMNYFFGEQGVFEKHSLSYGSIKQRCYAKKETFINYMLTSINFI